MKSGLFSIIILMMSVAVTAMETDNGTPPEPIQNMHQGQGSYALLFMGNSHSSLNDLPDLVKTLIETGLPNSSAFATTAPGWRFLADRLDDGVSHASLLSREWTHVILQAQKYSTSGLYDYPTDAAEEWIRRAKSQNALAVMFPEWPRRGNFEEGPRVHRLHLDIASREAACVAPIGLAWEASLARYPSLGLHASDGNHSNLTGALLTAYVLYEVVTGQSAADLPYIQSIQVAAANQQRLSEVASLVVQANQAVCSAFDISFDVASLEFRALEVTDTVSKTVTVTNVGIVDMSIDSITSTDASFTVAGGTCPTPPLTLSPSASCTVMVEFSPQKAGYFNGNLYFESDSTAFSGVLSVSGFSGAVIPTLNRWGILTLVMVMVLISGLALARFNK